jgi:dihydropteroate synthase
MTQTPALSTTRRQIELSGRPLVMGILNVTPDSFFDGGRHFGPDEALRHAERLIAEGADMLDVGGESSRPGAAPLDEAEEQARVLPVVRAVVRRFDLPVSIDTWKPGTARAAVAEGAEIINDIGGLRDPAMAAAAAETGAAVVAMHMRGVPAIMQQLPPSPDIMAEIHEFFEKLLQLPVQVNKMVLDPGIGFGKTATDNLIILNRLKEFRVYRRPLLVGVSRKSFIGAVTGVPADARLPGSLAAGVVAALHGADILRCHDVAETLQALQVAQAIRQEAQG